MIEEKIKHKRKKKINYKAALIKISLFIVGAILGAIPFIIFLIIESNNNLKQQIIIEYQYKYQDKLEKLLEDNYTRPDNEEAKELNISAYTSSEDETDRSPDITAFNKKLVPGTVAISRDLLWEGWRPGMKVYIEGYGVYTIADLMNKRFKQSIDIYMPDKQKAKSIHGKVMVMLLK
jgi:3D (Asp-Asp-Asp) domain-containing protein